MSASPHAPIILEYSRTDHDGPDLARLILWCGLVYSVVSVAYLGMSFSSPARPPDRWRVTAIAALTLFESLSGLTCLAALRGWIDLRRARLCLTAILAALIGCHAWHTAIVTSGAVSSGTSMWSTYNVAFVAQRALMLCWPVALVACVLPAREHRETLVRLIVIERMCYVVAIAGLLSTWPWFAFYVAPASSAAHAIQLSTRSLAAIARMLQAGVGAITSLVCLVAVVAPRRFLIPIAVLAAMQLAVCTTDVAANARLRASARVGTGTGAFATARPRAPAPQDFIAHALLQARLALPLFALAILMLRDARSRNIDEPEGGG